MSAATLDRWRYLLREAILFLTASYVVLLGGTFNGLILYRLNLISTTLIALVGGLWLAWRWRRRRPFPATRIDAPLAALLLVYGLASAASVDPRRSAGVVVLIALYALIYYLVVDLARAGWPSALFVKAFFFASLFVIFFGVWELQRWYAGWIGIAGWGNPLPPATVRISALLTHSNLAATFFALLLPNGLALALNATQAGKRLAWGVWCAAAAVLVFFTSSRSGWLGATAGVATLTVLLAFDNRAALSKGWRRLLRSPFALAGVGLLAVPALAGAAWAIYRQAQHPTHAGRDYIWSVAAGLVARRPLFGNGPFTFGTEFIRVYSVPPDVLLAHAHNLYLNVLAESGLLGGLALAWLLSACASLAWRRWRSAQGEERRRLAGLAAALVGLAVNSVFETPQMFPAINVLTVAWLGVIAAGETARRPNQSRLARQAPLGMGWLLVVGALAWSLGAYAPFSDGVLAANLGEWRAGARDLQRAAERDTRVAFYWLQAGYAHGRAGLDANGAVIDQAELRAALAAYERGVALEPEYSTNWANLGVLRWAGGDLPGARAALEQAVAGAPTNAAFQATAGLFYEDAGAHEAARLAYATALDLRPEWATAYFFRETPLRQAAAAAWRERYPDGWLPGGADLASGWKALRAGRYAEASEVFALAANVNRPEPFLGAGLAALGAGRYADADKALRTARFVPGAAGSTVVLTYFGLGRSAAAQGRPADAIEAYEAGLALIAGATSEGVGRTGAAGYGWFVFNRASIEPDLLPGVVARLYFEEAVAAMVAAGDQHLALGAADRAQEWYCQALGAAPDSALAQARAARQGGCQAREPGQP